MGSGRSPIRRFPIFLETSVRLDSDLRAHCRSLADSDFDLGLLVPKERASRRGSHVERVTSGLSGRAAFVANRISEGVVE